MSDLAVRAAGVGKVFDTKSGEVVALMRQSAFRWSSTTAFTKRKKPMKEAK